MANLGSLIEKTLPGHVVGLLREAGRLAEEGRFGDARSASSGFSTPGTGASRAYLVGGPVRDLLLGAELSDIDITVTGDGEAFGRALAERVGGAIAARSEFGTVVLRVGDPAVDIATARRESYAGPGALPDVEPGTLEEDLARRDFTVNAMAVDITPAGWGELIDNHGGQRDLTMRRLRVLHDRSFVDDPTRILRVLRYEARLRFKLDPHTLEYVQRDAHYLDYVSAPRILAELEKILNEPLRHAILTAAEERGVIAAIAPSLRISGRAIQAMRQTQEAGEERDTLFHVALIGASLTEEEAAAVVERLEPPSEWARVLRAGPQFRAMAPVLVRPDLKLSEIYDLLRPFPLPALDAQVALAPATAQRDRLNAYLSDLRFVKPECRGDDLLEAGVPQGPLVGKLLAELLTARLDRTVQSQEEELALVRRRLPVLLGRASTET